MSTTTTIKAGESAKTVTLPEGKAMVLTGAPGTSGVAYLLDQALGGTNSLRSWAVGAGALAAIGPYENTQKIHLTCSAGSIAATVKEAVLTISGTPTPTPTAPGQPAKPVLTAMAGAVSLAWTPGAAGSTATTSNVWTDINGNVTQLTTNPQTITAAAGTPYTGTVTTLNAQGAGPASAQADAVTPTAVPSAVPFDSAVAFSSGQQVLYAGGLYTFTAAHPAGNWTGNDVTYNGQNGAAPLNTVGFSKPMGVVQSWTAGVLATGKTTTPSQSRGLKMDAEAPFTKVRVAMFQREPTPQRGYAVSVASTETDAVGSLSNAISPIVNGTAHNVLKGADPYGFSKLTWAGAQRSPVQPGCGVTTPGQGYMTNMSSVFSDWADCASVPVVTGKRPMLVARLSRIVDFGDANSNVSTNGTTGSYNRYVANDPTGRLLINMLAGTNGDHAADPTLALNGSTYDPTTVSSWQNLAFMFEHGIPTRVFGGFGDSITEGYGIWQTPVLLISTQKAPCYTANFGCSTNRSAQYLALLESQLRGENYLTDIILPSFSPNEPNTITTAMADGYIAELERMRALCAVYKKRLYIWTSYAALTTRYAGTSSAAEINRINDWVRTEAAKTGATFQLIEIANGYDNATMTIGGSDNTHPNQAVGVPYFISRFLPAIQKGI